MKGDTVTVFPISINSYSVKNGFKCVHDFI